MELTAMLRDPALETAGVWLEYEQAKFKIASITCKPYRRAQAAAVKKLSRREVKDNERLMAVANETAEVLILDWSGVTNKGEEFPCTKANKIALINASPEFRDWLIAEASEIANFQAEGEREDVQALKSPSPMGASVGGETGIP